MDHVVTTLARLGKMWLPIRDGTHPFGDKGKNGETIEGQRHCLGFVYLASVGDGLDLVLRGKDRRTFFDAKNGVDVKVALPALDSIVALVIIFYPEGECASRGNRKIDLDGFGEIARQPAWIDRASVPIWEWRTRVG